MPPNTAVSTSESSPRLRTLRSSADGYIANDNQPLDIKTHFWDFERALLFILIISSIWRPINDTNETKHR